LKAPSSELETSARTRETACGRFTSGELFVEIRRPKVSEGVSEGVPERDGTGSNLEAAHAADTLLLRNPVDRKSRFAG
jgi:hypothetical protein